MNTPEKCPKCGAASFEKWATGHQFECHTLVLSEGTVFDGLICVKNQRDQLAERVRELEAWKESAIAVERELDPNQLAAMLGGQPGESQRAVIQREVPRLVERVKRLEEIGDKMAAHIDGEARLWGLESSEFGDEWRAAKGQP